MQLLRAAGLLLLQLQGCLERAQAFGTTGDSTAAPSAAPLVGADLSPACEARAARALQNCLQWQGPVN